MNSCGAVCALRLCDGADRDGIAAPELFLLRGSGFFFVFSGRLLCVCLLRGTCYTCFDVLFLAARFSLLMCALRQSPDVVFMAAVNISDLVFAVHGNRG
jgi:hypothetical protein